MFIQFIVQNPDINLNVVDYNKASLLIKAQDVANNSNHYKKMFSDEELKNRAIKAVSYLLKRGVDINYRDKNGITALLSACHWENNDIAKLLLENGADPNLASNINGFYTSPLISGYLKKNLELVVILAQYNVDVEDSIEMSQKGHGFKLSDEDVNFLRSVGNIAHLVRKRKEEQFLKKKTLLSGLSDMLFEDVCYNV